jgi:hypothetical protein
MSGGALVGTLWGHGERPGGAVVADDHDVLTAVGLDRLGIRLVVGGKVGAGRARVPAAPEEGRSVGTQIAGLFRPAGQLAVDAAQRAGDEREAEDGEGQGDEDSADEDAGPG